MRLAWVALVLAGAGIALGQAVQLRPVYSPVAGDPALEHAILELTNAERVGRGLRSLERDAGLALAARAHSEQMARLGFFDHVGGGPADRTLQQRVSRAGSTMTTMAENIAKFSPRPDLAGEMVRGWMDSPGHRANTLDPDFTHLGVGVVRDPTGDHLATQVFGRSAVEFTAVTLEPRRIALTRARFALVTSQEIGVFVDGVFHSLHPPARPFEIELEFPADGRERQIVLASRPRGSSGAFSAAVTGRLVPLAAPSWRPESSGGSAVQLATQPRVVTEVVEAFEVTFTGRVRGEVPVRFWVNGLERESLSGSFRVAVELTVSGRTHQVQFLRPRAGGGQFDVLHEVQVDTSRPPSQALRAGAAQ